MNFIKYENEDLYLVLGNYSCNNNLYIGINTKEGEMFSDLTINITDYMFEFDNEILMKKLQKNILKKIIEEKNNERKFN